MPGHLNCSNWLNQSNCNTGIYPRLLLRDFPSKQHTLNMVTGIVVITWRGTLCKTVTRKKIGVILELNTRYCYDQNGSCSFSLYEQIAISVGPSYDGYWNTIFSSSVPDVRRMLINWGELEERL